MRKFQELKGILKEMGSVLVAFSGGVDSALLLKAASLALAKNKVLAVTADSATYPEQELLHAKAIAASFGLRHKIIRTSELRDERFIANPPERCYYCKKELFSRLKTMAAKLGLNCVADGASVSDKDDFRPGARAEAEFKIRSPLKEAGFTKGDIRNLSRKLGLATWDKPSLACLASRIPYGKRISRKALKQINTAEVFLRDKGFRQVRLRHYNGLCRIEVPKKDIRRLMVKRGIIVNRLKKVGYNYITVDLEGFRTGSMNEVIKK